MDAVATETVTPATIPTPARTTAFLKISFRTSHRSAPNAKPHPQLHRKKRLSLVRMGTREALIQSIGTLLDAAVAYQIRAGREAREILEFVGQMGLVVVARR